MDRKKAESGKGQERSPPQSDATFNICCAIGALQVLQPGVYIAMSGRVFAIDHVRKNREARRFEEIP